MERRKKKHSLDQLQFWHLVISEGKEVIKIEQNAAFTVEKSQLCAILCIFLLTLRKTSKQENPKKR